MRKFMFSPPPEEFSSWPGSCQYIFVWSFALFILRMHPVSKRNKYCLYTKNNRRQSSREIITKLPDILTYYTTETDAPPTATQTDTNNLECLNCFPNNYYS